MEKFKKKFIKNKSKKNKDIHILPYLVWVFLFLLLKMRLNSYK